MNDATILVELLLKKTLDKKLNWKHVFEVISEHDINNLISPLAYILFQNEFHTVDMNSTFILESEIGTLCLIHEISESGRDGTIDDSQNLYAIVDNNTYQLDCDEPKLIRLVNAISEYIDPQKDTKTIIQDFVSFFQNID